MNAINTANTGTPVNVYYAPSTANDVTGLSAEYRGETFQRPNVSGGAGTEHCAEPADLLQRVHIHDASGQRAFR